MTDFDALQEFLTKYHQGMDEFMRGSCEGVKPLFSQTDDVALGNPFGPVAKGWARVVDAMERAARNYRDGVAAGFDNISTVVTSAPIRTRKKDSAWMSRWNSPLFPWCGDVLRYALHRYLRACRSCG